MADEFEQNALPEQGESRAARKRWADGYMLLHDLTFILAAVSLVFVFVLRLVVVDGYSMYPTLVNRDYVALESNVLYRNIQPGDVVVANVPGFREGPIVKRVIAVAGQTVDIDFMAGVVYVDGVALEEDYTYEPTYLSYANDGVQFPLTVREGCIFVLGDNRNDSRDSRYAPIGQIDTRCVLGRVRWVAMPGKDKFTDRIDFGRIGKVK